LIDAVVARVTGLAATGARVYAERPSAHTLAAADLPCLLVYDEGDTAARIGMDGTLARATQVRVDAIVRAVAGGPAAVRTICAQVETALGASFTLGAARLGLLYGGTEMDESAEADAPILRASLKYSAALYTGLAAPETAI
jgi:hypothetical protein